MPRDLESLEALLLEREIALHLADANLDAMVLHCYDLSDDEAFALIDPVAEIRAQAARKVASVKELIGYLTPSSYQPNYR